VRILPKSGLIVANAAEASLKRVLARGCWTPVEWFGARKAGKLGRARGDGSVRVPSPGQESAGSPAAGGPHNRANALAAVAAARHAGVPPVVALAALARFGGVKRRLEVRGTVRGVTVYDDFAHHPTAIAPRSPACGSAGGGRILAVLEPRSNTMKLGVMKAQLPASLQEAEQIFCYAANLGWDPPWRAAPLGDRAQVFEDIDPWWRRCPPRPAPAIMCSS
jgi:UDP-N-acetylmuramate: L-alanyl-gamma-D-glutamyl-meso-diaminopimelate ligase